MDIKNKLSGIIARIGEMSPEQVGDTAGKYLIEDYSFDSVKLVQLIVEIEDEFGIVIDDDEIDTEKINSLDTLLQTITNKVSL